MTENTEPLSESKFNQLRTNAEKVTIQSDLRRKLIGGISEEDVEKYINSVKLQFQFNENELLDRYEKLQASKNELASEFDRFRQKKAGEKAQMQEALDNALADLAEYMNQCNEKDTLIAEMDEKYSLEINRLESELQVKSTEASNDNETMILFEAKIHELEEQVYESRKIAEEYSTACAEMEKQLILEKENVRQLAEEKAGLSTKVIDIKSEINTMYKQLVSLDEQLDISESLKKQLEQEKLRADKAEQNMTRFLQCMSGIKDRFQVDQDQLERHIAEIEEKHRTIQSDVNGLRNKLVSCRTDTGTEISELYAAIKNIF